MKIDSRNGVHGRPSLPIVCMTMSFSMNSTPLSARLRTPVGAFSGSLLAASRKTTMPINGREDGDQPDLVEVGEDVPPADQLVDRRKRQCEHSEILPSCSIGLLAEL